MRMLELLRNNTSLADSLFAKPSYKFRILNNFEYTRSYISTVCDEQKDLDEAGTDNFVLSSATSSLAEEWENENDAYWESFLK